MIKPAVEHSRLYGIGADNGYGHAMGPKFLGHGKREPPYGMLEGTVDRDAEDRSQSAK